MDTMLILSMEVYRLVQEDKYVEKLSINVLKLIIYDTIIFNIFIISFFK